MTDSTFDDLPSLREATPFSLLGLPAKLGLGRSELDKAFREASKRAHPDQYAKAEPELRARVAAYSAAVNAAYLQLKTPESRVQILLKLAGEDLAEERARTEDPALLMEMMELQEEAETAGVARLEAMREVLLAEKKAAIALATAFFDDGEGDLQTIKARFLKRRYEARLMEAVDRRLESLGS